MVLPDRYDGEMSNLHYYQGLMIAEIACTLVLYLFFKIFHYVKWGHDEEQQEQGDKKNDEKKDDGEEDTDSKVGLG